MDGGIGGGKKKMGWYKVQLRGICMREMWVDGGEGHVNRGRRGSTRKEGRHKKKNSLKGIWMGGLGR